MHRFVGAVLAAAVALGACSSGGDDDQAFVENRVYLDEWSITGDLDVPAGTTIELENVGTIQHNVLIGTAGSDNIQAGETGTLDLTGLAPGTYDAWCTLPEHKNEGMVTTFRISG
jgi:uncharacterized cupredoxin-like copper-binding protein